MKLLSSSGYTISICSLLTQVRLDRSAALCASSDVIDQRISSSEANRTGVWFAGLAKESRYVTFNKLSALITDVHEETIEGTKISRRASQGQLIARQSIAASGLLRLLLYAGQEIRSCEALQAITFNIQPPATSHESSSFQGRSEASK